MGEDELPSISGRPAPPPEDREIGPGEHVIPGDGLWLLLDGESIRLDDPQGLGEVGDRAGVVGVALCELAIQRLIKAGCPHEHKRPS